VPESAESQEPQRGGAQASPRADLRAMTLEEAQAFAVEQGWPRFRGEQIWRWVHDKGARSFDDMTNLGRETRARLAETAAIGGLEIAEVQTSRDGTRKLRLVTRDGQSIESVIIPDGEKTTQCISSQVGCAVDCQFCATAKLGLLRNLDAGEIVDQVYLARRLLAEVEPGRRISNLVYMGMGEPLHNYDSLVRSLRILTDDKGMGLSQRRITVSTSGLVPKLERLGGEDIRPNLAVSLNAPSDAVRDEIMPINRKWNIAKLLAALKAYPLEQRRRITFEYVLLAGVNDAVADATQLAKLLRGVKCKVNIIPYNPHPEAPYARPSRAAVNAFQNECKRLGMPTYLRTPRGDDIDAACGQLANRVEGAPLVALRVRKGPPPPPPVE
jgi:23S rRNA (adenine2503-C2)-methyltransferase